MRQHLDIAHEGTIGTDGRTRMTFDEDSITHLMSVLIDLYSDPVLAVIREYSTNALDAHRAAGNDAPIEVTLPNHMNPIFTVTDHGTGMSVDQITNNFSKYGWSSKRDTDDEVGMLGLGCKSGLTYTSQFTLVSVKDGVQVTVLVTREETGAGAVQIIDTCATDLPNGTEVRIPTRTINPFNSKAREFFEFWEKGTVLVDGEEPEYHMDRETAVVLDPDVALVAGLPSDYIVMGNVPYPVKPGFLPRFGKFFSVIRVPIGSVDFTPSREALHYTKRTTDTVETARDFVKKMLTVRAQEYVEAAPTWSEAADRIRYWGSFVGRKELTYRGEVLPVWIETDQVVLRLPIVKGWDRDHAKKLESLACDTAHEAYLHVVGIKGNGLSAQAKEKIRTFCRDHNGGAPFKVHTTNYVLAYKEPIDTPWLEGVDVVAWDTIEKVKIDRPEPPDRRKLAKYRTISPFGILHDHAELPTDVVAWGPAAWSENTRAFVANMVPNKVASVLKSQQEQFVKAHPDIPYFMDWFRDELKRIVDSVDEWIVLKDSYSPETGIMQRWGRLDPNRITDPELAALVRGYRAANPSTLAYLDKAKDVCRALDLTVPALPEPTQLIHCINRVDKKYPHLTEILYRHSAPQTQEVYDYITNFHMVREGLHLHPLTY